MHHKVHFKHDVLNIIWERKIPFFAVFMAVLMVTYGALFALDFYPEFKQATSTPAVVIPATLGAPTRIVTTRAALPQSTVATKQTSTTLDTLPKKLIIEKLNKEVNILNPKENTVEALDTALLSGIARHPDSADFKKTGTMFLLGHSSYLPTVHNRNYQAFNGIQKLVWGDLVRIQSSDTEYLYRVEKSYEVKASRAEAEISWGHAKLIMVTCNSFATKDDRFVVEGYLMKSYPIPR